MHASALAREGVDVGHRGRRIADATPLARGASALLAASGRRVCGGVPARRRPTATATVVLVIAGALLGAPASSRADAVDHAPQQVAILKQTVLVRSGPSTTSASRGYVAVTRPITQQRTTLPVIDKHRADDGELWLQVRTPGRGTKRTGWIPESLTTEGQVGWRIFVDLSARRATIYYLGVERESFRVVVGKPSTPTPTGSFFVEENVREPKSSGVGPYALALSTRSGVYREFDGGPGQIALHGVGTLAGALGSAASHGCVRFKDSAINWLGERIDAGTPVTITS
jgi:lipoprotein-anchoring transpeptidase ErfK/SrfK